MAEFMRLGKSDLINLDTVTRISFENKGDRNLLSFHFSDGTFRTFDITTTLDDFAEVYKNIIPYYQSGKLA
jgi:hypothetical protein